MRKEDIRTLKMIASNCEIPKIQRDKLNEIIQRETQKETAKDAIRHGFHCLDDMCRSESMTKCRICEEAYERGYEAGRA